MAFAWAHIAYIEFFFPPERLTLPEDMMAGLEPRDKSGYCARFVVRYCLAGGREGVKKEKGTKKMASPIAAPPPIVHNRSL